MLTKKLLYDKIKNEKIILKILKTKKVPPHLKIFI